MLKRKIIFFISLAFFLHHPLTHSHPSISLPLPLFRSKRIAIHSVLSLWVRLCIYTYVCGCTPPPPPPHLTTRFSLCRREFWTFCFCYKSNVDIDNMFRMPILNWMRSNSIDHRKFPNLTAKKWKRLNAKENNNRWIPIASVASPWLPLHPHKCQPPYLTHAYTHMFHVCYDPTSISFSSLRFVP